MLTVLFRTVIIYILLTIAMRLMGKRQIGELEISDLVTTFLISEIASLPITDTELPLSHAIIPIVTLLALEVFISMLLAKFPKIKNLLSARPTTLIKDGVICQKAMSSARLSFDELFSELRQQGLAGFYLEKVNRHCCEKTCVHISGRLCAALLQNFKR